MAPQGGITAPETLLDLSSSSVITSVWVDGEKLSESAAPDVRALCTTLLNAYLIQLLDTGFLHADPHPGREAGGGGDAQLGGRGGGSHSDR